MIYNRLIWLIASSLFIGCNSYNEKMNLSKGEILMNIDIVQTNKVIDSVKLNISIESPLDTLIYFDYAVFENIHLFSEEENLIIKNNKNIDSIIKQIKYTEILLENKKGDMRFFSEDPYNLANRVPGGTPQFIFSEEFKLKKNEQVSFSTGFIRLSSLKVDKNDKHTRIHYLFKADSIHNSKGFKDVVLSSNWLMLPPF